MDAISIIVSFLELILTVVMAVLVVYTTMRAMIRTNTDFDSDAEIVKGNVAVGLLVAALLLGAANIMHQAFKPVVDTVHLYLTSPLIQSTKQWRIALYAIGNLTLAYLIVVGTLSISLRLFGRLARTKNTRPGLELKRGNTAIGVILATFVLIVSMFVGEGVSALSKALVPQPAVGRMQMME